MMVPGLFEMIAQARHEDLVREMKQAGLGETVQVRPAQGWQPAPQTLIRWIGMRLVALGLRLQGNGSAVSTAAGVGVAAASLQTECCGEGG